MHLIETYATNCGLKISEPFIYEKYIVLPEGRFVVFQPHTKPSKTYDLWQDVLDILLPVFHKYKITIVQIGGKNERIYSGVANLTGIINVNQVAFLIRNSELLFGADSFGAHVASYYNKPIVAIYANNNINNVKPYFSKNHEELSLIEPNRKGKKPTYSLEEYPKSINTINPETIANNILKKLLIQEEYLYKTEFIGNKYHSRNIEMVPDGVINVSSIGIPSIIVRMDFHHDESILSQQLQVCPCSIICDKPIDRNLLIHFKSRINQIAYIIKDDNDPDFATFLHNSGIKTMLITSIPEEKLNNIKIKYMELSNIIREDISKPGVINNLTGKKLFYKNGKFTLSKGKIFPSKEAWKHNSAINSLIPQICEVDDSFSDEFWEESQHFSFLTK